jgi:hypothetical protein
VQNNIYELFGANRNLMPFEIHFTILYTPRLSMGNEYHRGIAALEKASEGICGLIPDVVVPLCFFKIVLSTLEKQLMVVKGL